MIELLVIAGLYTLRLLLKMQWMTTVIFGLYMLVRVRIYRKRFRQIKAVSYTHLTLPTT
mgnify:CR=1 FL=1